MIFCTWNTKLIHFGKILFLFILRNIYIFLLKIIFFQGMYLKSYLNLLHPRVKTFQDLYFIIITNTLNYFRRNNMHLQNILENNLSLIISLIRTQYKQQYKFSKKKKILQKHRFPHAREKDRNRKFSRCIIDPFHEDQQLLANARPPASREIPPSLVCRDVFANPPR